MKGIVLFGTGDIADVMTDYLERFGTEPILAYTVDRTFVTDDRFRGRPVIAWEELPAVLPPGEIRLLGPVSYQRLNAFRRERHLEAKALGYGFANFIHPAAHVMADTLGENVIVLENCTIQPRTRIGDGVIVWSATHVGHHSTIGDFAFISSQVGIASGVAIGAGCMIGGQVGIDNGVVVGEDSYLQSRVVVRRNLPPRSVVRHAGDTAERYTTDRIRGKTFR